MHACSVAKSCLTLRDPMDCSLPGSSAHGIFQARILEWVAVSFSRGSSQPRDQICISCIDRWILYHCANWEAHWKEWPGLNLSTHTPNSSTLSTKESPGVECTPCSYLRRGDPDNRQSSDLKRDGSSLTTSPVSASICSSKKTRVKIADL